MKKPPAIFDMSEKRRGTKLSICFSTNSIFFNLAKEISKWI